MFVGEREEQAVTPASQVDLAALPTEHIEAEIERLAAGIAATSARWLLLVGEYDARDAWWSWGGVKSCAEWVAWRCSLTPRAAREQVRVARALRELPKTTEAFVAGELSYSKVRALSRVATPECEAGLIEIATHATAAQLERIVAGYRQVKLRDANMVFDERFLSYYWDADGSLRLSGSLPPEEGALFLRALEAARDELFEQMRAERAEAAEGCENGSAEPLWARRGRRKRLRGAASARAATQRRRPGRHGRVIPRQRPGRALRR